VVNAGVPDGSSKSSSSEELPSSPSLSTSTTSACGLSGRWVDPRPSSKGDGAGGAGARDWTWAGVSDGAGDGRWAGPGYGYGGSSGWLLTVIPAGMVGVGAGLAAGRYWIRIGGL
jgi:hypothetical protein